MNINLRKNDEKPQTLTSRIAAFSVVSKLPNLYSISTHAKRAISRGESDNNYLGGEGAGVNWSIPTANTANSNGSRQRLTNFVNLCHIPTWRQHMATMNISLPDPMKGWAEAQAQTGRYSNVSDYVRDLIRRDQETKDKIAHIQKRVDEGRVSAISTETMSDIRARALRQAELQS
jgi:antitoxin ParD1/3/4